MGFVLKQMCKEYAGLAWKFHVNPVSCENPDHYENFLRFCALSEQAAGRGVTHVFIDTKSMDNNVSEESRIVGFVTLRATSLVEECDGKRYVRPSLEVAELAIDKDYERNGHGLKLVDFSILMATKLNEQFVGVQNIVLCADPKAIEFYKNPKVGFGELRDHYILHDGWNNHCTPMFIKLCDG